MTEQMAIGWPELSLAREAPFGLAGTQVRPAALEVETDGKITALEPRVMKVLVALHRAHGKPVSRDELSEQCWGGRIVTEGALNRCVAQLRKALTANPRIKLDTIPTVGYRLQASAEVHRVGAATEAANTDDSNIASAPKPGLSRNKLIFAGAAAAAVIATVATLLLAMPRPVTWTAASFHPITSELGMETHPALSPSGDQIVYAQRSDYTQARDLYLRSVAEGTPVRITSHPADDYGAAWSPRGDRIAFVRTPPEGPCRIVVVPIPSGAEREVGQCLSAASMRLSWLNEDTLVISDRPTKRDIWRIQALDIATGQARDLTRPPASTMGDGDPAASPDGHSVVFRRTLMHGADDLFLLDVRTGRERALTTDGWKASGYVWSADSRHVFYSSNRGGQFGLWTVDTKTGAPPQRVSLGFGQTSFSRMSADRKNRLAVELPRGRGNLAALSPTGGLTSVTNATGYDWDPVIAPDGAAAYVSDRSGSSEIWVTTPDGRSVRLTSFIGSYINAPAWSPDGRSIAFVAVKGRRSQILIVDRDGSRLRAATDDGVDKFDPVYSPRGDRLTYVGRTEAGYRLMQVALTPGATPRDLPGGAGWRALRGGPDGRLYGHRDGDDVILPVNPADPAPKISLGNYDNWAVGTDGILVARWPRGQVPGLWLYPWSGAARKLADLPGFDGSMTVGADGKVLYSRVLNNEIDLGLVDLSSSS